MTATSRNEVNGIGAQFPFKRDHRYVVSAFHPLRTSQQPKAICYSKAELLSEKNLARLWIPEKLVGTAAENQSPFVEKIDSVCKLQEIVQIIVADQDPNLMSPQAFN
jgi:hypothetical protein